MLVGRSILLLADWLVGRSAGWLVGFSTDPEDFDCHRYSTLHGYADDLLEVLEALGVQVGKLFFFISSNHPVARHLCVSFCCPRSLF